MKIKALETYTRSELSVVKVITDDGREGFGQMSPFNADISTEVFHRQVAPHVLGKNPFNIKEIINDCLIKEYKYPGTYIRRALSGLDTSLWDLKGKVKEKSVCELLGGTNGYVDVYGSSMSREIKPEEEAKRLKKLQQKYGFKAFKIRIGKVCGFDEDQWPGRTEEIVPAVRKAIGEETKLYVDANSCYTPEKAIEIGKMLAQYNVVHFEEPCPYWKLDWTKQVTDELDVPVAGGEQDNSIEQWKRIVNDGVVDIVQPDICYIGGLSRAYQVAQMAQKEGLSCTPHSSNLSLITVFTLHFLKAIDNAGPFLEFSIEDDSWVGDLYTPHLEVEDGKVLIPEGPGWGVELNNKWLNKSNYRVSRHQ
ncbi:MAG: mandelate racemase/muconate lactonizing enzyme family protein [Halanaerobiaceae bacterium]